MTSNDVFLVSLYDKDPYEDWIRDLGERSEYRIVGTEGTAAWCREKGVDAETIGDVFGLHPRLGGKVKSLNPDLYTGVMAENPEDLPEGIPFVSGVAVDLTPYVQDGEFVPKKVDIGGPSLLRAAAKSWETVTVVSSPGAAEYHREHQPADEPARRTLASMAVRRTLRYDHELLPILEDSPRTFRAEEDLALTRAQSLRYGENPDQEANWDTDLFTENERPFDLVAGEELSYTNCLDAQAARRLVPSDDELQVSVIKHANPTGWARGEDAAAVVEAAWEGDPKSAFGSVIGINRTVTVDVLDALEEYFVAGLVAPDYDDEARVRLEEEGTRALRWTGDWNAAPETFVRGIEGGYLLQDNPPSLSEPDRWDVVGDAPVTDAEHEALRELWRIGRWVNSNAAVLGTSDRLYGVGAGQQSRVDAVRLAVDKYREFHEGAGDPLVLASDGFFPFPDNVEVAAEVGVDAIATPGGSKRDDEVLAAADEHDVGMVFTGTRAFYH